MTHLSVFFRKWLSTFTGTSSIPESRRYAELWLAS